MTQERMQLNVDTGSQIFDINDKGEIIGTFRFNPSDLDIGRRYQKVVDFFNSVSLPEDTTDEQMFAITDQIKDQFDYLLNYKVSEDIFAKANPLTPITDGDFYCENVLNAIGDLIEKVTDQRLKKKAAKIKRATSKYHK